MQLVRRLSVILAITIWKMPFTAAAQDIGKLGADVLGGRAAGTVPSPVPLAIDWVAKVGTTAIAKQGDIAGMFDPLTPDDGNLDPKYPPGPGLPSHCFEGVQWGQGGEKAFPAGSGGRACKDCGYQQVLDDLQRTRYRLEKLRRVYDWTKKFVSHSVAVGDSMAGAVGVGGLAWVDERQKILQAFKHVQENYDSKYAELMGVLDQLLWKLNACEEKVYNEKDWYNRFGFMYKEFMAGRYERAD